MAPGQWRQPLLPASNARRPMAPATSVAQPAGWANFDHIEFYGEIAALLRERGF
jgi:hypothetical protein